MRPWIKYSLIRVLVFAVVLAVLLLAHVNPFLATVIAAVAGFAISYIFFRRLRNEVALELANRNSESAVIKDEDTTAEDEALDRLE